MKICNNCNNENHPEADKCVHCQMAGDFRPKTDGLYHHPLPSDEEAAQCLNCGHPQPGEGPKCVHCHFPLQNASTSEPDFPKITVYKSRNDLLRQQVISKKTS